MIRSNLIRLSAGLVLSIMASCDSPIEYIPTAESQTPPTTRQSTESASNLQIPQQTEIEEDVMNKNNGNADVTYVRAFQETNGSWRFEVTVNHPDTGWEDYADGWDVLLEDGTVLKPDPSSPFTRLLLHPHVGEQPFTRSQSGIQIPPGLNVIIVRAHDIVDGFGGEQIILDLNQPTGDGYTVERQP